MSPDEREEQASLYALGLLEGDELAAFERELLADPELAALVSELQQASAQIALSSAPKAAPPAVKERVLQQITGRPSAVQPAPVSQSAFGWVPWAIAAGLAVFAGLTWNTNSKLSQANAELNRTSGILTDQGIALTKRSETLAQENAALTSRLATLETERLRLEERVTALEAEKSQLSLRIASIESRNPLDKVKAVAMAAQPEAPKGASVAALWDDRTQTGVLDLSKLPAAPSDKDYQLWILSPDSPQPISAGLISGGTPGAAFKSPRPLTQVAALAISLEPKGGSESPRGPVIYVGKM